MLAEASYIVRVRAREYQISDGLLFLDDDQMTTLEEVDWCGNAEHVKILSLGCSNLLNIHGITLCINLEHLHIYSHEIKDLTGIPEDNRIQSLHISCRTIDSVKGIGSLLKLKELCVNKTSVDPINDLDELNKLVNLELLDLSNNHLTLIKSLSGLKHVKKVFLSHNKLHNVPQFPINLEILDLSSNVIENLKNLKHLQNLKNLFVPSNRIKNLNDISSLKSLEQLDIKYNKLKNLKNIEKLVNLQFLFLDGNELSTFQGIERLPRLIRSSIIDPDTIDKFSDVGERIAAATFPGEHVLYLLTRGHNHFTDKMLEESVQRIKDDWTLINLGTKRESPHASKLYGYKFFIKEPDIVHLADDKYAQSKIPDLSGEIYRNRLRNKEIQVSLVQMYHSDIKDEFLPFCSRFWDVSKKGVLLYTASQADSARQKIRDAFKEIQSKSADDVQGRIIVFPENTIPVGMEDELKLYSKDLNAVIVGGLVHQPRDDKSGIFENKAIIIDGDAVGYQLKQTPVHLPKDDILENIQIAREDASISVFQTRFGKMSILICKDFLRFRNIIANWALANYVEFLIVPALTPAVLPFYARMIDMFMFNRPWNFRVIFSNIDHYGGSEIFTSDRCKVIEKAFTSDIGLLDNIGNGKGIIFRRIPMVPNRRQDPFFP